MSKMAKKTDVLLIGAGIMSATLGALIKELSPDWNIQVYEKLDQPGMESSNEWNNAGTGHSALCELNYTPQKEDGTVEIAKAVNVNEQFQLSRQFWAYLAEKGRIQDPSEFIMPIAHMSLVQGEDNIDFLRKRFDKLSAHPLFPGMEYTEDPATLEEWAPLLTEGRPATEERLAATKVESGTDVNFGALTRILFDQLEGQGVGVHYNHEVKDLKQKADGSWEVKIMNHEENRLEFHSAPFVFIGAGGGSLHLLQKTGIPESKQIGGFPVSGLFMVCNNEEVIEKHAAKIYGKAKVGAPPMSVPHLDTRFIDGKKSLLFGPFAGFSPKFLKTGSNLDLIASVKPNNVLTMLAAGAKEMSLTKYLIEQLMLSDEDRLKELKEFIPNARLEDWDIVVAGQRVQVIKDTEKGGKGTLQFGTEVVNSQDGSVAALLGASPGASTAVHVMLDVLGRCFPEQMPAWEGKIKEMIPSYGKQLADHPELFEELSEQTEKALKLNE